MDTIKATRELEEKLNNAVKVIKREKFFEMLFFTLSAVFGGLMVTFLILYIVNNGSGQELIFGIFALIFFSILIVSLGLAFLHLFIVRSLNQKVTILSNALADTKDKRPWRSEPIREEMIEVNEMNDVMKK